MYSILKIILISSLTSYIKYVIRINEMNNLKEKKLKKYTINEVAKLHNISKKALLYYEKKGIFLPAYIDESNSYRYYTSNQFSLLKTIIDLKELGIPLDEVKEYLFNTSSLNSIKFIEKQLNKIEKKKKKLQEIEDAFKDRLEVYEKAYNLDERYLNHVNFKEITSRKICYVKCENYPLGEEVLLTYRKVINYLKKRRITLSRYYGDIYLREGFKGKVMENVGVFSLVDEEVQLEDNVKIIPKGNYAYMYKLGGYPDEEAAKYFMKTIESKNFEIDGDILAFALLDYADTKDVGRMLYEFQVKVK